MADDPGVIHSAGLIVTTGSAKDLKVLAIIRRKHVHELAKGRVEENETFAECALRELQEETGCENAHVLNVQWKWAYVVQYPYNRKKEIHTKKVFWFYATLPPEENLVFGDREKATKAVEWILPGAE